MLGNYSIFCRNQWHFWKKTYETQTKVFYLSQILFTIKMQCFREWVETHWTLDFLFRKLISLPNCFLTGKYVNYFLIICLYFSHSADTPIIILLSITASSNFSGAWLNNLLLTHTILNSILYNKYMICPDEFPTF